MRCLDPGAPHDRQRGVEAAAGKRRDLVEHAFGEHGVETRVDALAEFCPIGSEENRPVHSLGASAGATRAPRNDASGRPSRRTPRARA